MPRLIDVVDKIENSGGGAFTDVNNDLGLINTFFSNLNRATLLIFTVNL